MSDTFRIENGVGFIGHRPIENADVCVEDAVGRGYEHRRRQILCKLANGYKLSIVFGDGTYCENNLRRDGEAFVETPEFAEIGVFSPNGDGLVDVFGWDDTVLGWQTTDEVWDWYRKIEELPT